MKLQKQAFRTAGDAKRSMSDLALPSRKIKQHGRKKSVIKSYTDKEFIEGLEEDAAYSGFKKQVQHALKQHSEGLTLSDIKQKTRFDKKIPNKWIKKLEEDIDLTQVSSGSSVIWKIENRTIFTTGYEGLSLPSLIEMILDNDIEQLIDVREIALSRKKGFSKGLLSSHLDHTGVIYKHLPSLGSPRSIRHKLRQDRDYKTFFHKYKKHLEDKNALETLTDLEGLAKVQRTVLMCYEQDHKKCHRSTVADVLEKRGWSTKELRD